jgi:hypothetical protein
MDDDEEGDSSQEDNATSPKKSNKHKNMPPLILPSLPIKFTTRQTHLQPK